MTEVSQTFDELCAAARPGYLYAGDAIRPNLWPQAESLYDLWAAKGGSSMMPQRADLSPLEMKAHLPLIALHDVEHAPFRLKVRLIGTQFVEAIGREPTGQYLDKIEGTYGVLERAKWVVAHKMPLLCKGFSLAFSSYDYKQYDSLVLPLGNTAGAVNMILYYNRFG